MMNLCALRLIVHCLCANNLQFAAIEAKAMLMGTLSVHWE